MSELIEANGLQFYVRDQGSGTPVLLLHGFPDTGDLWRNQVPALNKGGFRTIVPDMRGRGRSSKPSSVSEYRLSSIVRDVTGILDALGVQRAHVVGHDWSAAVAWLLAALAPERVDRLVAISVGAPGAGAKPTFEEFQTDRSAWRLFNAATYALTGRVIENANMTPRLHQVIDGVCAEVQ